MADPAPPDVKPPSAEAVKAAMDLLPRVPKTWSAMPELSRLEEEGLGLLVAADLVERRVVVGLRTVGDGRTIQIRFRFSGQQGLAQALEPGLAEAWSLWEKTWGEGKKVYAEPPEEAGNWRLTDQGELAVQDQVKGDVRYLRDVLRTPGVPGMEGNPPHLRFVPGVGRPMYPGEGHVERVEVVNAGSEPLSVRVENLDEVSGPLGDIARAVQEALDRLPKAKPVERQRPTGQGRRRGPAPLPFNEALRYVQMLRKWAEVQAENEGKTNAQRTTKEEFAGANGTTEPDVRSMQTWYRNQRNARGFPRDPRNLTDEELRKHFPRR